MESGHLAVYKSFNAHRVRYVLIGGLAAVLYGSPRLTKDVDLFIEPTLENAKKALAALKAIRFGTASLTTPQKLLSHEVTIFEDYIRVDLLTAVKGLSFSQARRHRVIKRIEGVQVPMVSLTDLIVSKKAAARSVDLEDVKILRRIQAKDRSTRR
ncbi:MAG: nucleotidyltransferase [Candidatus Omnitrophica bacterium]|nr:nucleotidyltransferase [Candidatus Omnitrophota bacterium]